MVFGGAQVNDIIHAVIFIGKDMFFVGKNGAACSKNGMVADAMEYKVNSAPLSGSIADPAWHEIVP